jgi:hypothetical protein
MAKPGTPDTHGSASREAHRVVATRRRREYTAAATAAACRALGAVQSMGRVGSALDNAAAEAFNSTLKVEFVHRHRFATPVEARIQVATWIVDFYNTRHHANPNHEDEDPDLEITALAFSDKQARTKHGVLRWVPKYQAFLFFPLLLAEVVMLRIASIRAVPRREVKATWLEAALLAAHIVGYLGAMFRRKPGHGFSVEFWHGTGTPAGTGATARPIVLDGRLAAGRK